MFEQFKVPFINTATMSIEEIATKVVEASGLHRVSKPIIKNIGL
jgi:regulator of PEP synthase PpsR (kinase-PPPase family)